MNRYVFNPAFGGGYPVPYNPAPAFGGPGDGYGCGAPPMGMGSSCGAYPAAPPGGSDALAMLAQAGMLSPDQLYRLGYGPCTINDTARGRMALFGWDSGANCNPDIQPGATVTLTNTAQSNFLIKGVDVTNSMADNFVASSIKVGNTELLLTTGNISLSIFKSDSCFKDLKACVASPGVEISITVTNIASTAKRFVATIVAEELPPGRCP